MCVNCQTPTNTGASIDSVTMSLNGERPALQGLVRETIAARLDNARVRRDRLVGMIADDVRLLGQRGRALEEAEAEVAELERALA